MPTVHTIDSHSGLRLVVHPHAAGSGAAAAREAGGLILAAIKARGQARVVFAAAPSQEEFLKHLGAERGIDWSRVHAFHMDEYVDLPAGAPQSFARWLTERLPPVRFESMAPGAAPAAEARRYAALLSGGIDAAFLGVGVNGHIAFNEPDQCRFDDTEVIRQVTLDEASRRQQVDDGCFDALADVPRRALTLTVPALLQASAIVGVVWGEHKAPAVARMVAGPIAPSCPASALRTHGRVTMFLDPAAASQLTPHSREQAHDRRQSSGEHAGDPR